MWIENENKMDRKKKRRSQIQYQGSKIMWKRWMWFMGCYLIYVVAIIVIAIGGREWDEVRMEYSSQFRLDLDWGFALDLPAKYVRVRLGEQSTEHWTLRRPDAIPFHLYGSTRFPAFLPSYYETQFCFAHAFIMVILKFSIILSTFSYSINKLYIKRISFISVYR